MADKNNRLNAERSAAPADHGKTAIRLFIVGIVSIFALSVIMLIVLGLSDSSAASSVPIPVSFSGEYSENGGAWQTLTEKTRFNALAGDLALRGRFDSQRDTVLLHAYLDHINFSVIVGGETEISWPVEGWPGTDDVGSRWIGWSSEALSGKSVEIRLSNDLKLGNPNAYNDFLDKLYTGPVLAFENYILYPGDYLSGNIEYEGAELWAWFLQSGQFWRGVGFGILMIALILFGVALADSLSGRLFGRKLWLLGCLCVLSFGSMAFDMPDASLYGISVAFNTCGAQLSRMLWMLVFALWTAGLCTGRHRTLSYGCGAASALVDVGLLVYCLIARAGVVNIIAPWIVAQALLCTALLGLCVEELRHAKAKREFLPALTLLCAVMLELLNARFGFLQRGILVNSVFSLILLAYVLWAVRAVPATFSAARRAEEQEKELAQSRISIMLSQIQPHFLYNALNTIQYLCETDPGQAGVATAKFSKYLRGNMSSLSQTAPVPIERELEHVKNYLYLECLRFPDMKIVYDIRAEKFLLPALTLQPLVENAVKHGIREREADGCITISTWQDENAWYVRVCDDGKGFDTALLLSDEKNHTGISNTRSRLKAICCGELSIESAAGAGTKATIMLPKEVSPCE